MNTTINGKTVKLLDMNDVSVKFTEIVNKYLSEGYMFYLGNTGHQGEMTKVQVTNDGKSVIIILLKRTFDCNIGETMLVIEVRSYRDVKNISQTLWLDEGEVLYTTSFYFISDKCFTMDLNVLKEIKALQSERATMRYDMQKIHSYDAEFTSKRVRQSALKILQKRKGFKSTKLSDIQFVENRNGKFWINMLKKTVVL